MPCLDCNCTSSNQGWDRTERCREEGNVTFVVKNQCLEDDHSNLWILGLTNYAVLIFLVIAVYFALDRHLDKETVIFDEDEQTAMDYSILIKNPPQNANNPEEWRDYFESNFEGVKVVAVSCNVNNDLLIKSLVRRRETLRRMELQLDHGALMDIDNLALLAAQEAQNRSKYFGAIKGFFLPGLPELLSNLVALNTSIKVRVRFLFDAMVVFCCCFSSFMRLYFLVGIDTIELPLYQCICNIRNGTTSTTDLVETFSWATLC